jgi:hypothetical protein
MMVLFEVAIMAGLRRCRVRTVSAVRLVSGGLAGRAKASLRAAPAKPPTWQIILDFYR